MRRLAWLSLERRSRSASISTLNSPVGFNFPPWPDCGPRASTRCRHWIRDGHPVQPVPILPYRGNNHKYITNKGDKVTLIAQEFE